MDTCHTWRWCKTGEQCFVDSEYGNQRRRKIRLITKVFDIYSIIGKTWFDKIFRACKVAKLGYKMSTVVLKLIELLGNNIALQLSKELSTSQYLFCRVDISRDMTVRCIWRFLIAASLIVITWGEVSRYHRTRRSGSNPSNCMANVLPSIHSLCGSVLYCRFYWTIFVSLSFAMKCKKELVFISRWMQTILFTYNYMFFFISVRLLEKLHAYLAIASLRINVLLRFQLISHTKFKRLQKPTILDTNNRKHAYSIRFHQDMRFIASNTESSLLRKVEFYITIGITTLNY